MGCPPGPRLLPSPPLLLVVSTLRASSPGRRAPCDSPHTLGRLQPGGVGNRNPNPPRAKLRKGQCLHWQEPAQALRPGGNGIKNPGSGLVRSRAGGRRAAHHHGQHAHRPAGLVHGPWSTSGTATPLGVMRVRTHPTLRLARTDTPCVSPSPHGAALLSARTAGGRSQDEPRSPGAAAGLSAGLWHRRPWLWLDGLLLTEEQRPHSWVVAS